MKRIGLVLAGLTAALLLVGEGQSGDKGGQPKGKPKLPQYWSKLGLSADQVKMVQAIRTSFGGKIAELTEKLDKLKKEQRDAELNVLTEAQRENLRRILLEKAGGPPKDKKSDTKDKKGG